MNKERFYKLLGGIDDDLIFRADKAKGRSRKMTSIYRIGIAAACLCIVVAVTAVSTVQIINAISPTPDVGETPGGNADSGNIGGDTEKDPPTYNTIEVSDEVIQMCTDTLYEEAFASTSDPAAPYFFEKINLVALGYYNATQVSIDPNKFYFLCGYYEDPYLPMEHYFPVNISKYTWLAFDSPYEIPQYYNGKEFVIAVQINRPSRSMDFLSGEDSDITVEHCQKYFPNFSNGYNINDALICEESYIYLSHSGQKEKKTFYYTAYTKFIETRIIPIVAVEEKTYLMTSLGSQRKAEEPPDFQIAQYTLGEYYGYEYSDYLMKVMVSDKYEVPKKNGYISLCGLFELEDIKKLMSNNVDN